MVTETEPDECLYCGRDDPESNYTWHEYHRAWICEDCIEERPWK